MHPCLSCYLAPTPPSPHTQFFLERIRQALQQTVSKKLPPVVEAVEELATLEVCVRMHILAAYRLMSRKCLAGRCFDTSH